MPHDLKRIPDIKANFPDAVLYSQIQDSKFKIQDFQILIIDSIGILSKIYSYADLAFIGGGFHSKGLHNILEAATFGIPVFFGNHYKKNPEADDLVKNKGAKSFENEIDAADFLIKILAEKSGEILKKMGENSAEFIHLQPNATHLIIEKILEIPILVDPEV